MDVCKVILLGRVGKDAEMKATAGGLNITSFSVATGKKKKDGSQSTEWHNITCFGKTAEIAVERAKKGARVYIDGTIQTDTWEKEGVKQYRTKIVANDVIFTDKHETPPPCS